MISSSMNLMWKLQWKDIGCSNLALNPPIRKGKILFWMAIYIIETRPRVNYRQHNLILYLFVWKKKSTRKEENHRRKNSYTYIRKWTHVVAPLDAILYLVTCKAHHFISNIEANIVFRWIGTVSSEYVINRLKTKICHHK